jgi:hypothetical protein
MYADNYLLLGGTVVVELLLPHIFYVRFRDIKSLQGAFEMVEIQSRGGGMLTIPCLF